MSLKIHGAFRMRAMSVNRFQQWCDRLRVEAKQVAERGFARYYALAICEKLDNHTLGFETLENPDIHDVMISIMYPTLGDGAPLESDWTFRLRAIADSRFVYLLCDYRYQYYSKLMASQDDLTPYNYQNSSDSRLDGATPEEWEQRARTWRRLLKHATIAECGVEALIVDKHAYVHPNKNLVKRLLPSPEERAARVTVEMEIAKRMDEMKSLYLNKPVMLYREAKRIVLEPSNNDALKEKIVANQAKLIDIAQKLA